MRMTFFVIMLASVLGLGAVSHASAGTHSPKADCEKCEFHKRSRDTGTRPPIKREVCFTYDVPGKTTFFAYSHYEGPNSPNNVILRELKHEGPIRPFCNGVQEWAIKMVWVEICNDLNHSARGLPSITEGIRVAQRLGRAVVHLCLRGRDCPRYVAGVH